ncbi:hypothetical protein EVAR_59746_1 [Eumeta japonica]|uniref:Uncharacterized protein n=1 Tax=Eumeta variegata TaxID=151549 RepID=A0A4C1YZF2_EUMVA|nr:hypothetical protein EVAR_59746_1 [Eumeta japonica]
MPRAPATPTLVPFPDRPVPPELAYVTKVQRAVLWSTTIAPLSLNQSLLHRISYSYQRNQKKKKRRDRALRSFVFSCDPRPAVCSIRDLAANLKECLSLDTGSDLIFSSDFTRGLDPVPGGTYNTDEDRDRLTGKTEKGWSRPRGPQNRRVEIAPHGPRRFNENRRERRTAPTNWTGHLVKVTGHLQSRTWSETFREASLMVIIYQFFCPIWSKVIWD